MLDYLSNDLALYIVYLLIQCIVLYQIIKYYDKQQRKPFSFIYVVFRYIAMVLFFILSTPNKLVNSAVYIFCKKFNIDIDFIM